MKSLRARERADFSLSQRKDDLGLKLLLRVFFGVIQIELVGHASRFNNRAHPCTTSEHHMPGQCPHIARCAAHTPIFHLKLG